MHWFTKVGHRAEPHSAAAFSRAPRAYLPEGFVMWNAFQRVKNVDARQLRKNLLFGRDSMFFVAATESATFGHRAKDQ